MRMKKEPIPSILVYKVTLKLHGDKNGLAQHTSLFWRLECVKLSDLHGCWADKDQPLAL